MNLIEQRSEDLIKHYIENYTILFGTLEAFIAALASLLYVKSGINLDKIFDELDEILDIKLRLYKYDGTLYSIKRASIFTLHDYITNSELNNFFKDLTKELFLYYKRIHNIIFE